MMSNNAKEYRNSALYCLCLFDFPMEGVRMNDNVFIISMNYPTSLFTFTLLGCYISYFSNEETILSYRISQQYHLNDLYLAFGNLLLLWVHRCLGANFSPHLENSKTNTNSFKKDHINTCDIQCIHLVIYFLSDVVFQSGCIAVISPCDYLSLLLFFRLQDEEKCCTKSLVRSGRIMRETKRVVPFVW